MLVVPTRSPLETLDLSYAYFFSRLKVDESKEEVVSKRPPLPQPFIGCHPYIAHLLQEHHLCSTIREVAVVQSPLFRLYNPYSPRQLLILLHYYPNFFHNEGKYTFTYVTRYICQLILYKIYCKNEYIAPLPQLYISQPCECYDEFVFLLMLLIPLDSFSEDQQIMIQIKLTECVKWILVPDTGPGRAGSYRVQFWYPFLIRRGGLVAYLIRTFEAVCRPIWSPEQCILFAFNIGEYLYNDLGRAMHPHFEPLLNGSINNHIQDQVDLDRLVRRSFCLFWAGWRLQALFQSMNVYKKRRRWRTRTNRTNLRFVRGMLPPTQRLEKKQNIPSRANLSEPPGVKVQP